MVTVTFPRSWLTGANPASRVQVDASSMAEVLAAVRERFPELQRWLDNGRGELPEYTHVVVGDSDVRILRGMQTPVTDSDTVRFVSALTGG